MCWAGLVALEGKVVDGLCAELRVGAGGLGQFRGHAGIDGLAGHTHDRGGRGVSFGATVIAAAAGDAVGFDGDVSEFAGHAIHAVEYFSAQDDAAANASAESDHGHVVDAPCRSQPLFAQGVDVGVVLEQDASAQAALDLMAHRIVGPAGKIGGRAHHPSLQVDDAGNADAGTEEPCHRCGIDW